MKHLSMQELEDLGFKLVKSYTHDEFMTQRRSKGVVQVDTTWDVKGEFISQDLTIIGDFRSLNFKPKEIKQLDWILNKKPIKMIKYKTIKNLGFKETDNTGDTAYLNTYGYPYKIFELETKTKGVSILWNQEDLDCTVMRCDKNGNILGQLIIHDEPSLIAMIELHGQKNKSK